MTQPNQFSDLEIEPLEQWPNYLREVRKKMLLYEQAMLKWKNWLGEGDPNTVEMVNADRFILRQMLQVVVEKGLCRHRYLNQTRVKGFDEKMEAHFWHLENMASLFVDSLRDTDIVEQISKEPPSLQAQLIYWLSANLLDSNTGLNYLKASTMKPIVMTQIDNNGTTKVTIPHHLYPGEYVIFAEPEEPFSLVTLPLTVKSIKDIQASVLDLQTRRVILETLDRTTGKIQLRFDPVVAKEEQTVLAGTTLHIINTTGRAYTLVQPYATSWLPGPGPEVRTEKKGRYLEFIPDHVPNGIYDIWCVTFPSMDFSQRLRLDVVDENTSASSLLEIQIQYPGNISIVSGAIVDQPGISNSKVKRGTMLKFIDIHDSLPEYRILLPWRKALPVVHPQRILSIGKKYQDTGLWTVKTQEEADNQTNIAPEQDEEAIHAAKAASCVMVNIIPALLQLETLKMDDNLDAFFTKVLSMYGIQLRQPPNALQQVSDFLQQVRDQQRSYLSNQTNLLRLGIGLAAISIVLDYWKVQKSFIALLADHSQADGSLDIGALLTDQEKGLSFIRDLQGLAGDYITTRELLREIGYITAEFSMPVQELIDKLGKGIVVVEAGIALRDGLKELHDLDYAEASGKFLIFSGAVITLSSASIAVAIGMAVPFMGLTGLMVGAAGTLIENFCGRNDVEQWVSHTWFGSDSGILWPFRGEFDDHDTLITASDPSQMYYKWLTLESETDLLKSRADLRRMITSYFSFAYWDKDMALEVKPSVGGNIYQSQGEALRTHLSNSQHNYPLQVQLRNVPAYLHTSFHVSIKAAPMDTSEIRTVWEGTLAEMRSHDDDKIRTKKIDQKNWFDTYWVEVDIFLPNSFNSQQIQIFPGSTPGSSPLTEGPERDFPFVIRNRVRFPYSGRLDETVFAAGVPTHATHQDNWNENEEELW